MLARPTEEAQHDAYGAIDDNNGNVLHQKRQVPVSDGEAPLVALEGHCPVRVVVDTCSF